MVNNFDPSLLQKPPKSKTVLPQIQNGEFPAPVPGVPPFMPEMPSPIAVDKGWAPPGLPGPPPPAYQPDTAPPAEFQALGAAAPGGLTAPPMTPGGKPMIDAPKEVQSIISQLMNGQISDLSARQQIASYYAAQGGQGAELASWWLGSPGAAPAMPATATPTTPAGTPIRSMARKRP